MRLLIANSNTTAAVTDGMVAAGRAVAAPGTEIRGANARFGPSIVGTRTEAAIATHGLIDLLAAEAAGTDAVLIGMSLDAGLLAARELLEVPVLGMTEAAMLTACMLAPRFGLLVMGQAGIVTGRELVEGYGLERRLAGIRMVDATPQDILAAPEAFHAPLLAAAQALVEQDGADAVVLMGAVLAIMPPVLRDRVPVPLLEGIACGVPLLEALVRMGLRAPQAGTLQTPRGRQTVGLGAALAARLGGAGG
jgi:allantoin racemase